MIEIHVQTSEEIDLLCTTCGRGSRATLIDVVWREYTAETRWRYCRTCFLENASPVEQEALEFVASHIKGYVKEPLYPYGRR